MRSTWNVLTPPPGHHVDAAAMNLLLDVPTSTAPGRGLLNFINAHVEVDYLSLVEYSGAVPSQVDGCTHGDHLPNITAECFACYKRQYSQLDEVTHLAGRVQQDVHPSPDVTVVHYGLEDIPDICWRQEIFEHSKLTGRLSFLYAPVARTAFAINLYRDVSCGPFAPMEIDRLTAIAPILRKVHLNALHVRRQRLHAQARKALVEQNLLQRAPRLSEREREVCVGIVDGLSVDGIAAGMGVAPSTVQTLRKRAYIKLGIEARSELLLLSN
ncbi:helix-turn-helix transcriptional regulator [Hydrogenophaga sp. UC242_50]|uniref:helix-turn-helix transcriptional regulator n=1 Tax=unclassified Hydrogenophaga TaxID=2610897 RepID=UPI0036D3565F